MNTRSSHLKAIVASTWRQKALPLALLAGLSCTALPVFAQQNNPPLVQQTEPMPGWLGVKISPVPDALKAHLNLEANTGSYSGGVMIRNIARNSPAEKAGLDRYDVIVKFNREPVSDDLRDFIRKLKQIQPGETIELTYFSRGNLKTKNLTLIAPLPKHQAAYKYARKPHRVTVESNLARIVVFSNTDKGWSLQEFKEGDLSALQNLPPDLRYFTQLWKERMEGAVAKARTAVTQGDRMIEVELSNNGKITVRRTFKTAISQQTETSTYDDENALAKADQAAFMVYQQMPVKPVQLTQNQQPVLTQQNPQAQPTFYEFSDKINGSIIVKIRRGTVTLTKEFASPEVLKSENAKIHNEYLKAKALESD